VLSPLREYFLVSFNFMSFCIFFILDWACCILLSIFPYKGINFSRSIWICSFYIISLAAVVSELWKRPYLNLRFFFINLFLIWKLVMSRYWFLHVLKKLRNHKFVFFYFFFNPNFLFFLLILKVVEFFFLLI